MYYSGIDNYSTPLETYNHGVPATVPNQSEYRNNIGPTVIPMAAVAEPVVAQPVFFPANQPVSADPLAVLNQFGGIRIVENVNLWETFTEYISSRKYAIFLTNEDGDITEGQLPYFTAFEESECCERQLCDGNRHLKMSICGPDGNILVQMDKPFSCSCMCLNTPSMTILDSQGRKCGEVKNQYRCYDQVFSVEGADGEECMIISGSFCQLGQFCFTPFEPCNKVIYTAYNNRTGTEGQICRKWDSWARQLFTKADTFTLAFPQYSSLHERILLVAATFLLNVMYFEKRKSSNDNSSD